MTEQSGTAGRDCPVMAAEAGRIEPAPRRVKAVLGGRTVSTPSGRATADSTSPVLVFGTGWLTRYYDIHRTGVAFEHLARTDARSTCPYKGRRPR